MHAPDQHLVREAAAVGVTAADGLDVRGLQGRLAELLMALRLRRVSQQHLIADLEVPLSAEAVHELRRAPARRRRMPQEQLAHAAVLAELLLRHLRDRLGRRRLQGEEFALERACNRPPLVDISRRQPRVLPWRVVYHELNHW